MENLFGLMEGHTRVTGLMVNNMEKESMLLPKELRSMENGKKEKESDGLEEMKMNDDPRFICPLITNYILHFA